MYIGGIVFGGISLANSDKMSNDTFLCALVLMSISFACVVLYLIINVRDELSSQKATLEKYKKLEEYEKKAAKSIGNEKNNVLAK
jgi:uncharacterized membrane protein